MSNLGEGNNTLTQPVNVNIEELSATVDLSKVTMRKHKKTSPHVQVENSKGPIAAESSHLNVGTGPSIELNSIKSKHDFIKLVFDVSLNSTLDIDLFLKELEAGKYPIWSNLDSDTRSKVHEAMSGLLEVYEMNTNATNSNSDENIKDTMVADSACAGVNVSIPRSVVEKVSARLEHTLYGYFIGNRMAFPVVEYYVKNNWAKYGLKKIMMNEKGFFFFKFDTQSGLEAVLEGGPWMIRKSPIILKKWSIDTRLCKEELTCIPVWVKLHDVPIQVFEEDGISLIASFIGKPIMLDSYTSSMCKDSWGRSSFARCLIEVSSEAELVEVVTIGVPSLIGDGFTKDTIRVEYEWRPPRCTLCKIFGHIHDHCPNKVVNHPVATTSNVANPSTVPANDGFQTVSHKKNKGKAESAKGSHFASTSVKQNFRYEPKKTTSEPKKGANTRPNVHTTSSKLKSTGSTSKEGIVTTSNSYAALVNDDEEDGEHVTHVNEDLANPNTGGSSSFTVAAG